MEQGQGNTVAQTFNSIGNQVDFNPENTVEKQDQQAENDPASRNEAGKDNVFDSGTQGPYSGASILGEAGINALPYVGQGDNVPLGEIVDFPGSTRATKPNEILVSDLPKAKDIDGLEPELLNEAEKITEMVDIAERYHKFLVLQQKVLRDRYNRNIGDQNDSEKPSVFENLRNKYAKKSLRKAA